MAEPWLIRFFACNRERQPFSFFLLFVVGRGGGISGRVRALNLTVPLGSGRVRRSRVRAGFGLQFWARADLYSSCSPLFVNLPHIFEWVLFHNPLQGAVIPIACTLFSTTSFPSLRLSINVLGHRALWTASFFCNDLLCLALLVQGVNGRLLDNCQVISLLHDCVAYRTRLRDHLKAFAGVLS